MVLLEKLKDEIKIIPVKPEEVHPLVLKHYLHKWPQNIKLIYGIYHLDKLIGAVVYGDPQSGAISSLKTDLNPPEVVELKRLFIEDIPTLPYVESYVIAKTLKMVKQDLPAVKVVITFADDKEGHLGTIYQATNAIYLGRTTRGLHKYAYILRGNLNSLKSKLQNKSYPKEN